MYNYYRKVRKGMNRQRSNLINNAPGFDNFEILKQYIIPSDTLTEMLYVYQLLGKTDVYEETLASRKEALQTKCIETDTFFIANFLHLDISDNRMRLIITKDSEPRNREEKKLKNIKEVLISIRNSAQKFSFNGSDILDYLNHIFGAGSHKFNKNPSVSARNSKNQISARLSFEKVLEKYHEYFEKNTFEHLHLSMVTYLEMHEIEPYSDNNEIARILTLYYMIFYCHINAFYYISFIELLFNNYSQFELECQKAVINYPNGYFNLNGIMRLLFNIIDDAYKDLKNIVTDIKYKDRAFKSDNIEQTIMQMSYSFTKEDIRAHHPHVSESTINRVLTKMRDENLIKPLGTGRSARWIKLIDENDPRAIFGKNYVK